MEEMLIFEVPGHGEAVALRAELAASHLCLVDYDNGTWRVQAAIGPDAHDFAALLRTVEAWVGRMGLYAIRFRVDGRTYVVFSGELDTRAAA